MNKNLLQKCQCICKYTSIDFLMKIHELQLSCIEQITGFGYPFGILGRVDRKIGNSGKKSEKSKNIGRTQSNILLNNYNICAV